MDLKGRFIGEYKQNKLLTVVTINFLTYLHLSIGSLYTYQMVETKEESIEKFTCHFTSEQFTNKIING
jgi:hypothetical protein